MINFHSAFSKDAASSADTPRNWRSELGTFWRDIEEAGSVAKAIRLRGPAKPARNGDGEFSEFASREGLVKTSRWAHFRMLCIDLF
jgi:hypothetical protein